MKLESFAPFGPPLLSWSPDAQDNTHSTRTTLAAAVAVCALGLVLRILFFRFLPNVLTDEGVEYARMAENLFNRHRLLGMIDTGSGPQLLHSPLYPLLAAVTMPLTGSADNATRLISLLMGAAAILAIFLIANALYGAGVAFVAGLLTAVHPYLLWLSVTANSEATFIAFTCFGLFWGIQFLRRCRMGDALVAGLLFGLAYLSRPTAVALPLITGFMVLAATIATGGRLGRAMGYSVCMLGLFSLLALPYTWFQYQVTGRLALETKTPVVRALTQRMHRGMDFSEAAYGIDEDLLPAGPELDHTLFIRTQQPSQQSLDWVQYVRNEGTAHLRSITKSYLKFSVPLLAFLAVLGLLHSAWRPPALFETLYLVAIASCMALPLLLIPYVWPRYYAALIPFTILWAAKGAQVVYDWLAKTTVIHRPLQDTQWKRLVALALLTGSVLLCGALFPVSSPSKQHISRKAAGQWLAAYDETPKVVMDVLPLTPYYARGTWKPLPYAEGELALRYIEQQDPDYIVLSAAKQQTRPYLAAWYNSDMVATRSQLIYASDGGPDRGIKIFEWQSAAAP